MSIPASPMQDAIKRFVKDNPGYATLTRKPAAGARPGAVSTGRPTSSAGATGSPALTESDYTLREYHPAVIHSTSDGVFTFEVEPIKSLTLVSGDKMQFQPPPAETP